MLDAYSDAIVLRHKFDGAARLAAEVAEKPVINAGDGKHHHPTQAMLDLYTIRVIKGEIGGLVVGVLGDLKYSRAAASFLLGLTIFKPKLVYLISPPQLTARPEILKILSDSGVEYRAVSDYSLVVGELDILYVTRIQRERFPDPEEYEKVRGSYRIELDVLQREAKPDLKILHPLPKVDEIDARVDNSPFAAYYTQASLGVPLRMALLLSILGGA